MTNKYLPRFIAHFIFPTILTIFLIYIYGYISGLPRDGKYIPVRILFWWFETVTPIPLILFIFSIFSAHIYSFLVKKKIIWRELCWYELGAWIIISILAIEFILILFGENEFLIKDIKYMIGRDIYLSNFLYFGSTPSLEELVFIFTRGSFPVIIGIFMGIWATNIRQKSSPSSLVLNEHDIKAYLCSILQGDVFINTLQTAVPTDEKDKEYGLHGVSWVLASIFENKSQFRKSAQTFLTITIALGAIMLFILFVLGYILVNDEATGLARRIKGLYDITHGIASNIVITRQGDIKNEFLRIPQLLDDASKYINSSSIGEEVKVGVESVIKASKEAFSSNDLKKLVESLQKLSSSPALTDWKSRGLLNEKFEILRLREQQLEVSTEQLISAMPEFKRQIDDLRQLMAKPESRVPDLIKRIAVGLLVVSFMIAVLRYSAGLYQRHLTQVIRATEDEIFARRFFVAFKGAKDVSLQRQTVLAEFMKTNPKPPEEKENSPDSKLVETLAAQLVKALSKKLD